MPFFNIFIHFADKKILTVLLLTVRDLLFLKYSTFSALTSPRTPGRCKISDNTNPRLPTGLDDPAPVYGTPPAAAAYAHSAPPARWSFEEFRIHEVGAGAGGQITAVFHQLHPPQVDLPVSLDRFLNGASGLGKCRRVQNDHVELLSLLLQPRGSSNTSSRRYIPPGRKGYSAPHFLLPALRPVPRRPRRAHAPPRPVPH